MRVAKKRFESGKEVSQINANLEKEQHKNSALADELKKTKEENQDLRYELDAYKNSYEYERDKYETLAQKFFSLQGTVSFHDLVNDQRLQSIIDKLVLDLVAEIEEKDGMITKLKAQINRDFHTSSTPSSQFPNRQPIQSNREKTGNSQILR